MKFLISLRFSKKQKKGAPLVAEAVIEADNMQDAIEQVESGNVDSFLLLRYGHSYRDDFKPNRKGNEGDFENFLRIAAGYDVHEAKPEDWANKVR